MDTRATQGPILILSRELLIFGSSRLMDIPMELQQPLHKEKLCVEVHWRILIKMKVNSFLCSRSLM